MKILVIGANGKTGQKLLKQLSSTGHAVSGLIRSANHEALITQYGAVPLYGDLEAFSDKLIKDFEAIIFVAGSRGKNVQGVDYQGLVNAVDACVEANVKRFLYIGSINAGKSSKQYISELVNFYHENDQEVPEGLLNNTKNPKYQIYIEMKTLAEKYIIDSELDYTILRAGLLTEDEGSGKVSVTEGVLNRFGKTSRENIAACFIEILNNIKTFKKTYTVLDGDTAVNKVFGE